MVIDMKDNGTTPTRNTDLGCKPTKMVVFTKETGVRTSVRGKVDTFILMGLTMKVSS
jgi:tRNA G18 (ribose-2'-O)-methylase SpoU